MRALVGLLFLVVACGPNVGTDGGDPGDGEGADANPNRPSEFTDAQPASPCDKMDILFIVDDSGSMGEEQANLSANFPEFITVINDHTTTAGDLLDYRVAVTTTGRDVDYTISLPPPFGIDLPMSESGDNGEMLQKCGMNKRWLERSDPDVSGTFSCAANVGTSGPSLEMPLYTMELAFSDRMNDGTNTGFLREDALLALVIITDENDCSRRDNNFTVENDACDPPGPEHIQISESIAFLDNLTGDRSRWAAAVIAGPGPGNCESAFGQAFEATRLIDFVNQTGANATFSSICDGDLSGGLAQALATFESACEGFDPIL